MDVEPEKERNSKKKKEKIESEGKEGQARVELLKPSERELSSNKREETRSVSFRLLIVFA